jgi:hypothetical protein
MAVNVISVAEGISTVSVELLEQWVLSLTGEHNYHHACSRRYQHSGHQDTAVFLVISHWTV